MNRTKRHGGFAAMGALLMIAPAALAGDGNITPATATDTSSARKISMKLGFTAPIPPPVGVGQTLIEHAVQQLIFANHLICDMTDGQFRIEDVSFVQGEGALASADILWFPQNSLAAEAGGHSGAAAAPKPAPLASCSRLTHTARTVTSRSMAMICT